MSFSDMDMDLIISLTALLVSGLTGIVGMWIERDPDRGVRIFSALAALCFLTTAVSMWQAVGEARDAAAQEEKMANVLQKLDSIMQKSGVEVPAINELVKSELASASRENPNLVRKVAQRVADSGGNPASVLGSYLPKDEVKRIQRSGTLAIKQAPEAKEAAAAAPEPPRKELKFGDGPAQMRRDEKPPASSLASAAPVPAPAEAAPSQLAAAPAPEPPAAAPPEQPPAAAAPSTPTPAVTSAPAANTAPKVAPKPKPVVRKVVPRGDVDIYEEAEQDLRRTRPK